MLQCDWILPKLRPWSVCGATATTVTSDHPSDPHLCTGPWLWWSEARRREPQRIRHAHRADVGRPATNAALVLTPGHRPGARRSRTRAETRRRAADDDHCQREMGQVHFRPTTQPWRPSQGGLVLVLLSWSPAAVVLVAVTRHRYSLNDLSRCYRPDDQHDYRRVASRHEAGFQPFQPSRETSGAHLRYLRAISHRVCLDASVARSFAASSPCTEFTPVASFPWRAASSRSCLPRSRLPR